MQLPRRVGYLAIAALAMSLVGAVSSQAQWMVKPPPTDSPYWWTLTDGISPRELRAALQSREKSRERLLQAIDDGHWPQISDTRIQEVSLAVDGERDPDLFPMWDAFQSFADQLKPYQGNEETEARKSLTSYGISPGGVNAIIAAAQECPALADAVWKEVGDRQREFAETVLTQVEKRVGRKGAAKAIVDQDMDRLSNESGVGRERVADLYQTWLRDPWAESAIESLQGLRPLLSESDWDLFRQYLLERVAPRMHYFYFGERPLR